MSNPINIYLQRPYPAQQKILNNRKRNNLLLLSRRWGKTTITKILVAEDAIITPEFRVAWSAPTHKLLLDVFEEFVDILAPITARVNREERRIKLINNSLLEFWSSNDPSAGRGRKYHRWVSDETQRQRNLSDFIKGSVRPCLADFRGELWILGTANGEGTPFHDYYLEVKDNPDWQIVHGSLDDNPFIHPDEILQMRKDLGPLLAAQELDSQWVPISGMSPLISSFEWEGLIVPLSLSEITRPQKVLALDASISGDTTGLIAPWRDPVTGQFSVDYDDIFAIEPTLEDPETGVLQIDFVALEQLIWRLWQTGRYAALVYDPYQLVFMAQRFRRRGIRTIGFDQNNMRTKSDSYLKQVLSEKMFFHPNHPDLTEHVKNATIQQSTSNRGLRIVKKQKGKKIDLAVALGMGIYAMSTLKPGLVEQHTPDIGSYSDPVHSSTPFPQRMGDTPFAYLQNMKHNPFKK